MLVKFAVVRNTAFLPVNFKKCGLLFSYGEQINNYHVFVLSLDTNMENIGYFCADVGVAVYLVSRQIKTCSLATNK